MEVDLDSRNAKWNRGLKQRREQAKCKIEAERQKRVAAAKAREALESLQQQKRVERLAESARQAEQLLEEQRLTGGIKYVQELRPFPTMGDGDKITLPASALEALNPQNALELGVFTFELWVTEMGTELSEVGTVKKRRTHAGVLEFVAEEGTVGLPPKVAASLFRQMKEQPPATIHVRFVRLEQGKFARLQPRGDGFGDRQIDLKHLLECALQTHTTLTEGDVLFVRHGRETFEVIVSKLKPERAVRIVNTDLEVDLSPCEAVVKAAEEKKRLEVEAARAAAVVEEKEIWKANKMATLVPEPSAEACAQTKVVLRTPEGPATRRFLHASPLRCVFEFVEALTGENSRLFQLATTYPRQLFGVDAADKTLQELGLSDRQVALFVEKLAADADMVEPGDTEDKMRLESARAARACTQLPRAWDEARQSLERRLDASMHSTTVPAIHAMEPAIAVTQSTDQAIKWQAQLSELEQMGFMNRPLNIEVLEKYQGRLLRVVNFLSEMASTSEDNGVTVTED